MRKLLPRMPELGSRQEFGKLKRPKRSPSLGGPWQTRPHPDEPRTVSHDDYA